jgi:hypothetical protein
MKSDMKANSRHLKATTLVALIAALAVFGLLHKRARAEDKEEFLAFGVTGITRGQTARLHAVPVGVQDPHLVELIIYDSQGNVLAQSSQRLVPGRAATLSLDFASVGVETNRLEIYTVMRFVNGAPRRGYIIPTMEVIDDDTGKTLFMSVDPTG